MISTLFNLSATGQNQISSDQEVIMIGIDLGSYRKNPGYAIAIRSLLAFSMLVAAVAAAGLAYIGYDVATTHSVLHTSMTERVVFGAFGSVMATISLGSLGMIGYFFIAKN